MIKKKVISETPRIHEGKRSARGRREKEIVRASSLPLSAGAQILFHYLSSSADNSYSPRYVRSVLSLTSALMLFNMAHSLVRRRVDTCCAVSFLSLPLLCPALLLKVHSVTFTFVLWFTQRRDTQTHHPLWSAFCVCSNLRGFGFHCPKIQKQLARIDRFHR